MCVIADTQAAINARNIEQGKRIRSFFVELARCAVLFFAALFIGLFFGNAYPLFIGFFFFIWRMTVHHRRLNRRD